MVPCTTSRESIECTLSLSTDPIPLEEHREIDQLLSNVESLARSIFSAGCKEISIRGTTESTKRHLADTLELLAQEFGRRQSRLQEVEGKDPITVSKAKSVCRSLLFRAREKIYREFHLEVEFSTFFHWKPRVPSLSLTPAQVDQLILHLEGSLTNGALRHRNFLRQNQRPILRAVQEIKQSTHSSVQRLFHEYHRRVEVVGSIGELRRGQALNEALKAYLDCLEVPTIEEKQSAWERCRAFSSRYHLNLIEGFPAPSKRKHRAEEESASQKSQKTENSFPQEEDFSFELGQLPESSQECLFLPFQRVASPTTTSTAPPILNQ